MALRTLYLTDLDGTLLGRGARLSAFSRAGLERLYDAGVAVTAATARSWSALDVLQGVRFRAPMILLGGARIYDAERRKILFEQTLPEQSAAAALHRLRDAGLSPLIYTQNARDEQKIYYEDGADEALRGYVSQATSGGDNRFARAERLEERFGEKLFYLTARGEEGKLRPIVEALKEQGIYAHLYFDVRRADICCIEVCAVSKAEGVRQLRRITGAERIVAFGDNGNDRELFAAAEERIAVGNARPELKAMANCVIGENESDAVVRTILEREGL